MNDRTFWANELELMKAIPNWDELTNTERNIIIGDASARYRANHHMWGGIRQFIRNYTMEIESYFSDDPDPWVKWAQLVNRLNMG